MRKIVLCNNPSGCCPEVTIDDDKIIIRDEGNSVTITRGQFNILKKEVK